VHKAGEITLRNDTSRPRDEAYPELELLLLDKPNSKLLLVFISFIIVVSQIASGIAIVLDLKDKRMASVPLTSE
jgi:hypothetical protein